jgi:ribonuclease HI
MSPTTPHYLLVSQVDRTEGSGQWRFLLKADDGAPKFEAADREPGLQGERLDLLTIVRALESLDQPSEVTLVDCSDYVWKGVRYGLHDWSTNGWRWEFFGQMVPVKNSDLWQRMDRVLQFHKVDCRRRRFDPPHDRLASHGRVPGQEPSDWGIRENLSKWVEYAVSVARRCVCERRFLWRAFINWLRASTRTPSRSWGLTRWMSPGVESWRFGHICPNRRRLG